MIERIKSLCEKNGTNFKQLEAELGFANGSLAKSKVDKISYIRLQAIADYFGVTPEYIAYGDEANRIKRLNLYASLFAGVDLTNQLTEEEMKQAIDIASRYMSANAKERKIVDQLLEMDNDET